MTVRGYLVSNPINILSDDEVNRIHCGTLEILEETGVVFEHKKALEILESAGCKVDFENKRVRFPSYLVEQCIRRCPSSFTMKAREDKNSLRFGRHTLYFTNFVAMDALDVDTGQRRTASLGETIDAIKVLDALDNIHWITSGPYFNIQGVPPVMVIPTTTALRIKHSSKATCGLSGYDCDIWEIKMAKATNQQITGIITSSPPLTWGESVVTSALRYLEAGFPITPGSGLNFGGNGPATIAGSMILNNAELLSMLVLAQVFKPGSPFMPANYQQPMDMRTGQPLEGAIEKGLSGMVFAQMWRYYDIPCWIFCSSDSKVPDYQCGYEKGISALLQALAGPSVFFAAGSVHDELTWSPFVAAMDNDIYGMIGRVLRGVKVTEETLAIDLIKQVGPIPGNYLNTAHTRNWWKHELFIPVLADRMSHPEWLKAGGKNIVDRAKERVKTILESHQPDPLPDDQSKAVDEILEEAQSYYRERGMI